MAADSGCRSQRQDIATSSLKMIVVIEDDPFGTMDRKFSRE
ncbi:hypothetical protein [Mesorhizobium sp.]|nr:hypothetical protein [Mesorhizobium sp.]